MSAFKSRGNRKPYVRPVPRGDVDAQWVHDMAPKGPRADINGNGKPRIPTGPAATLPSVLNNKLIVSNLHYEVTPQDLSLVFGHVGTLVREPLIRYDRSGRSSGSAIVTFERLPRQQRRRISCMGYSPGVMSLSSCSLVSSGRYLGMISNASKIGQPMSIAYEPQTPRQPRRAASAPTSSLINRIQKAPLLDRLSRDDTHVKASNAGGAVGPIRSRPIRSLNAPRPRDGPKKPKTVAELDKELDAFMGDAEPVAAPELQPETLTSQDEEMS
ncbi:hypothetical protein BD779DRAFT_1520008 [Infundibulicybe gibba]|nr:hypothetical protein BD779DRAFT_1520008 [Infundibulicybe gibba]